MEVLRSNLLNKESDIEEFDDNVALNGIYGPNGFFFQERRGHLNLRALSKLNLEKLIREVDIDLLQNHIENIAFSNLREEDLRYLTDPQIIKLFQISQLIIEYLLYSQDQLVYNLNRLSKKYSNKKRTLTKKRKELAELQESTKYLRHQVKAKKRNISTLEDLLKESNRINDTGLKQMREIPIKNTPIETVKESDSPSLRFFVAGTEGLCVEFKEMKTSLIDSLISEIKRAFVSKKDLINANEDVAIKLYHKGRLLLVHQTLESCGIKNGDTLVAVFDYSEKRPIPSNKEESHKSSSSSELFEFLAQQQKAMRDFAIEIKEGYEKSLQAISSARPSDKADLEDKLINKIDQRWENFESSIRHQLDAKLQSHFPPSNNADNSSGGNTITIVRRKFLTGDLESDTDDVNSGALNEINSRLRDSNSKITSLESQALDTNTSLKDLKEALYSQNKQMEDLKAFIANQKLNIQHVVHQESPSIRPVDTTAQKEPPKKRVPNFQTVKSGQFIQHAPVEEAPKEPAVPKAIEKFHEDDYIPIVKPISKKYEEKLTPKESKVTFEEKFYDTKPDDGGEEITPEPQTVTSEPKQVQEKPKIVYLKFPRSYNPDLASFSSEDFFEIPLASDLPPDDILFEIRNAFSKLAKVPLGRVQLCLDSKTINFALDIRTENFSTLDASELAISGRLLIQLKNGRPITNAQIDFLVPNWEKAKVFKLSDRNAESKNVFYKDDEKLEPGMISRTLYRDVKASLDGALSEVSDKEGLTDDEVALKFSELKSLTDSLPEELSDHISTYRSSLADAMGAVSIENGVQNEENPRRSLGEIRDSDGSFKDVGLLRTSQSLSLRQGKSGFLRVSSSGLRRSYEQFEEEHSSIIFDDNKDDTTLIASLSDLSEGLRRNTNTLSTKSDSLIYSPSESFNIRRYELGDSKDDFPTRDSNDFSGKKSLNVTPPDSISNLDHEMNEGLNSAVSKASSNASLFRGLNSHQNQGSFVENFDELDGSYNSFALSDSNNLDED